MAQWNTDMFHSPFAHLNGVMLHHLALSMHTHVYVDYVDPYTWQVSEA